MSKIKFNSEEHEMFYGEMLSRAKSDDVYYKAFFCCMGVCPTTRKHIDDLFDLKRDASCQKIFISLIKLVQAIK